MLILPLRPLSCCSAEWVATYSSPEYLALPDVAESILDQTARGEPYGEWLLLTNSFCPLAIIFWDMGVLQGPWDRARYDTPALGLAGNKDSYRVMLPLRH